MLALTACAMLVVASQPVSIEGKVREVAGGPAGRPQAILVADSGHHVLFALDPAFANELRRLSGLVVRVTGVTGDPRAAAKDDILVDRYEIKEIGKGVVPRVGRLALLRVGGQQSRLVFVDERGEADLLPAGWSRKMKRHAGAKVWMVGRRDRDGSFRPQRFAILRAPTPVAPAKP